MKIMPCRSTKLGKYILCIDRHGLPHLVKRK
jgi:hypothetical protein